MKRSILILQFVFTIVYIFPIEYSLGDSAKDALFNNAIQLKGLAYGELRKLILEDSDYEKYLTSKLDSDNFNTQMIASSMLEWGKRKEEMLLLQSETYVNIWTIVTSKADIIKSSFSVTSVDHSHMEMLLGIPFEKRTKQKNLNNTSELYMIELAMKGLTSIEFEQNKSTFESERWESDLKHLGILPYEENEFKRSSKVSRCYAIGVLVSHEVVRAIPVLEELLVNGEFFELRVCAAKGLGMMKDMRSVEALIDVLNDEDSQIQDYVKLSLIQLTGKDFDIDVGKYQQWMLDNPDYFKENSGVK